MGGGSYLAGQAEEQLYASEIAAEGREIDEFPKRETDELASCSNVKASPENKQKRSRTDSHPARTFNPSPSPPPTLPPPGAPNASSPLALVGSDQVTSTRLARPPRLLADASTARRLVAAAPDDETGVPSWRPPSRRELDRFGVQAATSPQPLRVVELAAIRTLVDAGPSCLLGRGRDSLTIDDAGALSGVEAAIDKDLAAELIARDDPSVTRPPRTWPPDSVLALPESRFEEAASARAGCSLDLTSSPTRCSTASSRAVTSWSRAAS